MMATRSHHVAATLQVVASLVWIPQALLISVIIGAIADGRPAATALWPAAGIFALGILRSVLDAIGSRRAYLAARASLSQRRAEAAAALAAHSPLDKTRIESGRAASIIAEQAEAIVPYLTRYRTAHLRAFVVPIIIALWVLPISWAAAIALVMAAPLIPIFMALIGWRAKAESEARLVALGSMNAFLLDRLRGLATIRTLDAVDATARRLRNEAESLRTKTMSVLRIAFLSSAALEFFAAIGIAMVAVYIGFHLLGQIGFGAWGATLSLEQALFILLLAPAFFEPLRELSGVWHDRAAGIAAIEALDSLTHNAERRVLGSTASETPRAIASNVPVALTIQGMRFCHWGATRPVFDGFDLHASPGEKVAILGPSGSGKSTLLALIAGLARADAGEIKIGGHRLDDASAAALRAQMAWIGQQPHIFSGTLASNVKLGRPCVTNTAVARALRSAKLDGVWRTRRSTPIGEGGIGLSGGEALRLALARLAATNGVSIILADEPTSHLDAETSREIIDSLLAFSTGRTLIVATHDPVLAARMDRIVRLDAASMENAA